MEGMESPSKSRSTYAEGGSLKKGKLSGVKRIVVLAVVPDIKETNKNFALLFNLIRANDIYLSTLLQSTRLNSRPSERSFHMWPCPYCFIQYTDLGQDVEEKEERTFGDLETDHQKFKVEMKGNKNKARYCHSTVNPCVLVEDPSMKILEKYILPELHSILGFMNYLFFDGLCNLLTRERALL